MRNEQLLGRLGVYVNRTFMSQIECDRLSRAVASGAGHAAEIYGGADGHVDETIRCARQIDAPADLTAQFQARMEAAIPVLAAHFNRPLAATEQPSFLIYEAGDFFKPHRDRAPRDVADGGNETFKRRVTAVVFLNRQAVEPGEWEYAGGDLTLFGLIDDPAWHEVGFPIVATPGTLVAFDASTLHEVTPVVAGRRITAVEWLA
jgi:predicted 2-oxoglutarate/Fe(II)-dependent dioxygenase YbiX